MRNLLLLSTLILINSLVIAQSDTEKMNLLGKVKRIKETSFRAIKRNKSINTGKRERAFEGAKGHDYEIYFNKFLNKTKEIFFESTGDTTHILHHYYDNNSNKVKWYCFSTNSTFLWGYDYFYNELHQKISFNSLDKNKEVDQKQEYSYNPQGLIIKETTSYDDHSYTSDSIEYDSLNRKIRITSSSGDFETFQYQNNIKTWTIFNRQGDTLSQNHFTYDINNNIIKSCSRDITLKYQNQIKTNYCVISEFDDNSNIISELWIDREKPREKETFKYTYDKTGNWIQQIHYFNNRPRYIIKREIEYY